MSELAYLVIREGGKWSDVFRLIPGQATTIGRAPTNQIVLKDDRCSRNHVEVFFSSGQWILRDLDSRNGTMVGSQRISADHPLPERAVTDPVRGELVFTVNVPEVPSELWKLPLMEVEDLIEPCAFAVIVAPPLTAVL